MKRLLKNWALAFFCVPLTLALFVAVALLVARLFEAHPLIAILLCWLAISFGAAWTNIDECGER